MIETKLLMPCSSVQHDSPYHMAHEIWEVTIQKAEIKDAWKQPWKVTMNKEDARIEMFELHLERAKRWNIRVKS